MALFVNEGRAADLFGPGRYVLNTQTMPILTYIQNWDKAFKSPFKSDVYYFSTRQQINQKWGTQQPVTIRDKEFGAVRLRAFGIYSYHISDPRSFHAKISGTQETYRAADLEGQLRNMIVGRMSDTFAESGVPFLTWHRTRWVRAEDRRAHEAGLCRWAWRSIVRRRNPSMPEELQRSSTSASA
jgi:membrane protease subunit (stomatin/prohibitin family)